MWEETGPQSEGGGGVCVQKMKNRGCFVNTNSKLYWQSFAAAFVRPCEIAESESKQE